MPRFIFFKGLYSTLDLYTDEMLRICRERGYDSFVLHTTQGEDASCMHISEEQEKEERKELLRFLKEPVTAAVGIGNMGLRYEMDGIGNIWDAFAVPYIDVMMDHPFHFSGIFPIQHFFYHFNHVQHFGCCVWQKWIYKYGEVGTKL